MSEEHVIVYTPDSSLANPLKMAREMVRDLLSSRELAWRLVVRDISAQYRQAFLGILWAFILSGDGTFVKPREQRKNSPSSKNGRIAAKSLCPGTTDPDSCAGHPRRQCLVLGRLYPFGKLVS